MSGRRAYSARRGRTGCAVEPVLKVMEIVALLAAGSLPPKLLEYEVGLGL